MNSILNEKNKKQQKKHIKKININPKLKFYTRDLGHKTGINTKKLTKPNFKQIKY